MSTIRRRASTAAGITAGAALVASSFAIYALVRLALLGVFDEGLMTRAHGLIEAIEIDDERAAIEVPEHLALPEGYAYEIRTHAGGIIAGAPVLVASGDGEAAEGLVAACRMSDGRSARLAVISGMVRHDAGGKPTASDKVTARVLRDTTELDATLTRLAWVLAVVAALAGAAVVGVMRVVMRGALRPLDRLSGQIADLRDGWEAGSISVVNLPGELAPIVGRLNELLDRLRHAFAKEKSFNAAIAHELRTPLAGLRTTIEVCQTRERMPEEYRRTLGTCQRICAELQGMTERLLTLAKADAGQMQARPQPVDLRALLDGCWLAASAKARERAIAPAWSLDGTGFIHADPDLLRIVVQNLIDNAVSHGASASTVTIEAIMNDQGARVRVANPGCRLAPEEVPRVFERFWRGDSARSGAEHCGLGLALCHDLVRLMGGTIAASVTEGVFVVEVRLPR
jgi:two-component system, OmpR family, heavy metal sensor histidine kinase CusS